ncbi:hypothetical protein B0A55_08964 [Friedmanniomyces simplex]|uniref:HhH-GPD domain-containing protein n=1 Tax=Friedmanniomyces simplex TaxID=329884 RepID=A0A4U0WZ80_9PEZI|nr:hypothetical protein B0A55_08964 [Friedmanniomyces simplex]
MVKRQFSDVGSDGAAAAGLGDQRVSKKRKPNNLLLQQHRQAKQNYGHTQPASAVKVQATPRPAEANDSSPAQASTRPGGPPQPGASQAPSELSKRQRKRQNRARRRSEQVILGGQTGSPAVSTSAAPPPRPSVLETGLNLRGDEHAPITPSARSRDALRSSTARNLQQRAFEAKQLVDDDLLRRATTTKLVVPPTKHWVEDLAQPVEQAKHKSPVLVDRGCQTEISGQMHLQLVLAPLPPAVRARSPQRVLEQGRTTTASAAATESPISLARGPVVQSDDAPMEDPPVLLAIGSSEGAKLTAQPAPRQSAAVVSTRDTSSNEQDMRNLSSDHSADDNVDDRSDESSDSSVDDDGEPGVETDRATGDRAITLPPSRSLRDGTKPRPQPVPDRIVNKTADAILSPLPNTSKPISRSDSRRCYCRRSSFLETEIDQSDAAGVSSSRDEDEDVIEPKPRRTHDPVAVVNGTEPQPETPEKASPAQQPSLHEEAAPPQTTNTATTPSTVTTSHDKSRKSADSSSPPQRTPLFAGINTSASEAEPRSGRSVSGFRSSVSRYPKPSPAAPEVLDPREAYRRFSDFVGGDDSSEDESSGSESEGEKDDGQKGAARRTASRPEGVLVHDSDESKSEAEEKGTPQQPARDIVASAKTGISSKEAVSISSESEDESDSGESDGGDDDTPQQPAHDMAVYGETGIGSKEAVSISSESEDESDGSESDAGDESAPQQPAHDTAVSGKPGIGLEQTRSSGSASEDESDESDGEAIASDTLETTRELFAPAPKHAGARASDPNDHHEPQNLEPGPLSKAACGNASSTAPGSSSAHGVSGTSESKDSSDESDEASESADEDTVRLADPRLALSHDGTDDREPDAANDALSQRVLDLVDESPKPTLSLLEINNARASQQLEQEAQVASQASQATDGDGESGREDQERTARRPQIRPGLCKAQASGSAGSPGADVEVVPGKLQEQVRTTRSSRTEIDKVLGMREATRTGVVQAEEDSPNALSRPLKLRKDGQNPVNGGTSFSPIPIGALRAARPPSPIVITSESDEEASKIQAKNQSRSRSERRDMTVESSAFTAFQSDTTKAEHETDADLHGTNGKADHPPDGYSEDDSDVTDVPARASRSKDSSNSDKAASASRTSSSIHYTQVNDPSSFLGSCNGFHGSGRARSRESDNANTASKMFSFTDADDEDVYRTIDEIASDVFNMTSALPTSQPLHDAKLGAETNGLKWSKRRRRVLKAVRVPAAGHNTVACYPVQVEQDELEPPTQVSGETPVNHSSKRDRNVEDGPVAETPLLLLRNMESSSLSDLGTTPSPPHDLTSEAEATTRTRDSVTDIQGVPLHDQELEPTPAKKRRMTGATSKHWTLEKRAKTRSGRKTTASAQSAETESVAPKVEDLPSNQEEAGEADIDDEPAEKPGKKKAVKRKSTPKKSPHFERTHLFDRVDLPSPSKPRIAGVSSALAPPTTRDHFGIIQEKVWDQPFWLLIAVTLLNQTTGRAAVPTFWDLKKRYVTPESLAAADPEEVRGIIRHLGLQNVRTIKMIKMAKAWVAQPPVVGKRYRTRHYPKHGDHREYLGKAVVEKSEDESDSGESDGGDEDTPQQPAHDTAVSGKPGISSKEAVSISSESEDESDCGESDGGDNNMPQQLALDTAASGKLGIGLEQAKSSGSSGEDESDGEAIAHDTLETTRELIAPAPKHAGDRSSDPNDHHELQLLEHGPLSKAARGNASSTAPGSSSAHGVSGTSESKNGSDQSDEASESDDEDTVRLADPRLALSHDEIDDRKADAANDALSQRVLDLVDESPKPTLSLLEINNARASQQLEQEAQVASQASQATDGGGESGREDQERKARRPQTRSGLRKAQASGSAGYSGADAEAVPGKLQERVRTTRSSRTAIDKVLGTRESTRTGVVQAEEDSPNAPSRTLKLRKDGQNPVNGGTSFSPIPIGALRAARPPSLIVITSESDEEASKIQAKNQSWSRSETRDMTVDSSAFTAFQSDTTKAEHETDADLHGTNGKAHHPADGYSEDDSDVTDVPARASRSKDSSTSDKAASASRTSPSLHSTQVDDRSSFLGSRNGFHASGRARSRESDNADTPSKMFSFTDADDEDVYRTIDEIASDVFNMTSALPTSQPLDDAKLGAEKNGLKGSKIRRRVVKAVRVPAAGHNTVACYPVQVEQDELEPPTQVSGETPVNHSSKRDRNVEDGPVAETPLLLLRKMESSSLSDLGTTPSPPRDVPSEAEATTRTRDSATDIQGGPLHDQELEPTPAKKRRMTGATSKHWTLEKRAKTRSSRNTTASAQSVETESVAPKAEDLPSNEEEAGEADIDDEPAEMLAKKKAVKRKSTPKKSPHFERTHLLDRVDLPSPSKPRIAGVSSALAPPTTRDHFGIIQEKVWDQPFWLLIAVTLLNQTTGRAAVPTFWDLKNRYVTPESLAAADPEEVRGIIRHLGLQNVRTIKMIKMAKAWVAQPPVVGKRYRTRHYPKHGDHREYLGKDVVESDAKHCAGALEIAYLPGCGSYAWDSWRIFCRDVLRGVAEDYRGKGAAASLNGEEGFEPEWMRVLPLDKELRVTVQWMWLREGWMWDCGTGEKRRATEEEVERGRRGEMELVGEEGREFAGIAVRLGGKGLEAGDEKEVEVKDSQATEGWEVEVD